MTRYERAALKVVNRIRRAEGRKALKRLPKGDHGQERSCPVARALDHGKVGIGETITIPIKKLAAYLKAGLKFEYDEVELVVPDEIDAFVSWFDGQADDEARELVR